MKKFDVGELRLDEKALNDNLGAGNVIFVGSSTDMFANEVPKEWIKRVLLNCKNYEGNTYLFQTKAPQNFWSFSTDYPRNVIFGVTLETNRDTLLAYSLAPNPKSRVSNMKEWFMERKMISIEPIIDFDLNEFVNMIKEISPEFVSIGADSKNSNLPEPSKEKIEELIKELRNFTEVKLKYNLKKLSESRCKE
jgi:DNA repair photolyase